MTTTDQRTTEEPAMPTTATNNPTIATPKLCTATVVLFDREWFSCGADDDHDGPHRAWVKQSDDDNTHVTWGE